MSKRRQQRQARTERGECFHETGCALLGHIHDQKLGPRVIEATISEKLPWCPGERVRVSPDAPKNLAGGIDLAQGHQPISPPRRIAVPPAEHDPHLRE